MNLLEWWRGMFGHKRRDADEAARVILSASEHEQAARLSRLTGRTRDEVLREAYRKADRILGEHR